MSGDFKGAHVDAEEKSSTNKHKLQKKTPRLMKNLKENKEMLLFLLLFLI